MEFAECLYKDVKKKEHFLYIGDKAVIIATGSPLLLVPTKYEFHGFNDDLRTPLLNEYHCHKAGFSNNKDMVHYYV